MFVFRKVRSAALQAALLALVAGFFFVAFQAAHGRLEQRGIGSGFGFLDQPAGFKIIFHLIAYDERSTYGAALLVGILNTLLLSAVAIAVATVTGFLLGIARLSPNWLVRVMAAFYVEVFRNIPPLLQIFFWYFSVLRSLPTVKNSFSLGDLFFINNRGLAAPFPAAGENFSAYVCILAALALLYAAGRFLLARTYGGGRAKSLSRMLLGAILLAALLFPAAVPGVLEWSVPSLHGFWFEGGFNLIPEFLAVEFSLIIYTSAYIAEIVRAGFQSVRPRQIDAGRALGLTRILVLRHVILPQALRVIIPPLSSQYMNLVKNTSLASAIAFPDLVSVFAGTVLNQTGQAVEVMAITMTFYFVSTMAVTTFMNWYNARMRLKER
ncbi:MAG: amino acid ABC transporter permease [Parvibaculaceae bacterium]